ncbi:hypothetical protein BDZ45DRAFT_788101 [Acephala macrosclerotiorum]|nr:hypothetical protein BDZ45DRAFT_788101 [Acephala macrosclerotiorum]
MPVLLRARGADPNRSNALHHTTLCQDPVKTVAVIILLIENYTLDIKADGKCGDLYEMWELDGNWNHTTEEPLNWAVERGNIPVITTLLSYGADPLVSLRMAIYAKKTAAVRLLLEAGAGPTKYIGLAMMRDYLEGVELCLEYGGDLVEGEA